MTDLAPLLHAEGVEVRVPNGVDPDTLVAPGSFTPIGICVHHTAGTNSLDTCIHGRPEVGVPGPLCNLLLPKQPFAWLISNGRANDTGMGASKVDGEVRTDQGPLADAVERGLFDDSSGNPFYYDIEVENRGDGQDPYPDGQLDVLVRSCAAICRHHGWSSRRVIGHRTRTRRKVDPRGIGLAWLRGEIDALLTSRYLMVVYAKPGTDAQSAWKAHKRQPDGVVTLDLEEVAAAIGRGEPTVTVGGPASREIHGDRAKPSSKPYLLDGTHIVVFGQTGADTRAQVEALADSGWKVG